MRYWDVRFGPMPAELRVKVEQVKDAERLQRMLLALYRAQSLEEAQKALET